MISSNYSKKKKICIVTGSRAEFGILSKFFIELKKKKNINLNLIVTGSHFNKEQGNTKNEILSTKIRNFNEIKVVNTNSHKEFKSSFYCLSFILSERLKKKRLEILMQL